ncbi:MAG: glycosyltransferase family 2 protein [Planctomycetes bacterium]|nr:glycosyltransferase family 2 protein [Planctomycetota bacterium]
MTRPRLSVVVPAYNESRRLPPSLETIVTWARAQPYVVEIVVVDDGSTDGTRDVAERGLANVEHQILVHDRNLGKGAGIRTGMRAAKGEFVLFSDADLSTPIDEATRFLAIHETGAPIVIGTRKNGEARVLVRQNPLRERMGRVFTWLSNVLICPDVSDFTCVFKSFRADVAAEIFSRALEDGWAYDTEVLFLARRLGYPIREVAVPWTNDPSTRVRLVRDAVGSFLGLLRIRRRAAQGRYRLQRQGPAA